MPLDIELDLIVPQTVLHTAIVSTMVRVATTFPWTAGQVVKTSPRLSNTPSSRIQPLESGLRLTVKDDRNDTQLPTFAQMQEAGYPMSMLDESVWRLVRLCLAPCPTIASSAFGPSKTSGIGDDPAPVMLVQLGIIRDGLVLCISLQHNVCDMMGQAAVMGWLSKACRKEEFTREELNIGNADQRIAMSSLSDEAVSVQNDLKH
ncbi:hypothetical protein SNOG_03327 [Parastagonospora nodorum SN15]|uniref:Trichothecene 3-O-acetyltransferase-like N-terminal domain-containing protein n=1 Tax=Phaeosphaeria nodorum (strain SN15 / ATCC MYA-4574 / FGSC 10173) TaxID=321614 RepID=Q0UY37_PHANO|nr:hypothetical protein SNOG_03327 [Parastagonospora nodorum SN15]EAT90058.1 hypothetical protein SNOG_03327 [Parastagonospora nodorum SN15]